MWSLLPNSPQAPDCAICGVTLRLHQQMHGLALYAFKTEVDSVRWSALSRMHISTPCTASDTLLELVEFQQLPFLPPSPLFSFPRVCGAHPTLTPFCPPGRPGDRVGEKHPWEPEKNTREAKTRRPVAYAHLLSPPLLPGRATVTGRRWEWSAGAPHVRVVLQVRSFQTPFCLRLSSLFQSPDTPPLNRSRHAKTLTCATRELCAAKRRSAA